MSQRAYKSMMYVGGLLTILSVLSIAADGGALSAAVFCAGFLSLLAGAVGYLWNVD